MTTQLRNKFNQLRNSQMEFSNLIKEKGVSWNSRTGSVTAADEVWQCLYKVKSCMLWNDSSSLLLFKTFISISLHGDFHTGA